MGIAKNQLFSHMHCKKSIFSIWEFQKEVCNSHWCCTWKSMVRVSDGEIGTTTGCCSEVDDGCCCCSISVTSCSCCCWVSSSTALTTSKQRFFFIDSAFKRGWHGKVQNWRDWEEEEETGNVEEERRIEWRDEDENSVAIFWLRCSRNWFVLV